MKTITGLGTAALAVALAASAPAEAQLVLFNGQCHAAESCETVGEACAAGGICVTNGSSEPFCISRTTVPCCSADDPCPDFDGAVLLCTAIAGLTTNEGSSASLCVEPFEYCDDTLEGIQRCHTESELSTERVRFLEGDCDRDGLSNGEEIEIGSNHCATPLRRGVDLGGTCVLLPTACSLAEPCTASDDSAGECRLTEDANGTRCFPPGETERELYCAGEDRFDCAAGELIVTVRDRDFCVPSLCAGADIDIEDCVRDDAGEPVPFDEGDCDRDGVTNGAEKVAETDLCAEPGDDDGGAPELDAGSTQTDAGPEPTNDGGGIDASDVVDPRFEGGGGCSCRTSGGSRGSPAWLGALAALALVVRRRR